MTQPFTNRYGWPPELVTAILKNRYTDESEDPFDFSASTIVAPVQMTILKQRHPDKLVVEDVSDMFWRFMGSIAHSCLEEAWHDQVNGEGDFIEKRLYVEIQGKVISGKPDLYSRAVREVRDYKSTKAYKIMKGDYEEWEKAQNVYAYLIRKYGFPVDALTIIPLVFDFKEAEKYKKNYPESQSGRISLKLWTPAQQLAYIEQRVGMLNAAEHLSDEELTKQFPCSEKEMWQDLKDWAIVKPGAAKATHASLDSEAEATTLFRDKGYSYATHQIVKRMSGRRRCARYCAVRNICLQNRRLSAAEGKPFVEDLEPCIF